MPPRVATRAEMEAMKLCRSSALPACCTATSCRSRQGEAVFHLKPEAQLAYLDSLSGRGVAALLLEALVPETRIPARFIEHAQQIGLPVFRLEVTVPFVELAERTNRRIVSEHASPLQQADEIAQLLARHMASAGPNLRKLLEMIEQALGSCVVL